MSDLLDDRLDVLLKEIAETRRETVEARRETMEARRETKAARRELAEVQRELAAFRVAIEGADVRVDPAPTVKDQLFTRKQAARYAGIHPTTLDRLAKKHTYLYVSDGNGRRRYSRIMLDDFTNGRL